MGDLKGRSVEVAGDPVVIQFASPMPVVEMVQRHLPVGAAVVIVLDRDSAMAKFVDATGVERCSVPFGDHVSLQEAVVVAARSGRSSVSESKILESVRDCVAQVRAAESVESGLIHGFHLLAKHTMSHYAMHRLRRALVDERDRREAAEDRADVLQQRLSEADLACEECGAPEEVLEAIRGVE